MAKVSYANLKLKTNTDVNTFEFQGQTIEVLKYLPIEDKYDLVMIALQKAEQDGIYNPILLDLYFHLYLVYMYTNVSFTERQKDNEPHLYDTLASNGFMKQFLDTIEVEEYEELMLYVDEIMETTLHYKNTAGAVLQSVIQDLPKNAQAAADIVNSFAPEKYQAVVVEKEGKLYAKFTTTHFSTYAISDLTTIDVKNPETADNISNSLFICGMSIIILLLVSIIFIKKNKISINKTRRLKK
jgi:hypothetical protein